MDRIIIHLEHTDSSTSFHHLTEAAKVIEDSLTHCPFLTPIGLSDPTVFSQLQKTLTIHWPALFSKDDSLWLASRISPDSLHTRLDKNIQELFTLGGSTMNAFMVNHDPFGLSWKAMAKLAAFRPGENIALNNGFLTNKENSAILLFAEINRDDSIKTSDATIVEWFQRLKKLSAQNHVTMLWMGAPRASFDNEQQIKKDINLTAPLSIVFILILCISVYQRKRYGFLAFLPTIVGIILTLGLFSLFTSLSFIMLGFGAALLGITIDYAVHVLFHFDHYHQTKHQTVAFLYRPILASAVTTATAFGVLIVAGIPGLSQLGMVTAIGILFVALLALVFLPVLLNQSDDFKDKATQKTTKTISVMYTFFSKLYRNKKGLVFLSICIIAISTVGWFYARDLSFDGNPYRQLVRERLRSRLQPPLRRWRQRSDILRAHRPIRDGQTQLHRMLQPG